MPERQPPEGDPTERLRDLSRQWATVADHAFASAQTDPATYTRTVRLVSAILEALRSRGDSADELLAAWSDRRALVTDVASSDELLTAEGLDLESVAGAAFAMRYREVAGAIAGARRLAALAEQDADVRWAVVEESGPPDGDPFVPYRRLEVDPRAGRGILVTTRANDDFSAPVHVVEELGFDRTSGALTPPERADAPSAPREFAGTEERERYVAGLRGDGGSAS